MRISFTVNEIDRVCVLSENVIFLHIYILNCLKADHVTQYIYPILVFFALCDQGCVCGLL